MGLIGERILDPDAWVVKGDHSFNANQKITVSLNTTDIPRLRIDSPLPDPLAPGLDQRIKGYTGRISYDYIIRPDLLHQLSLGYNLFDHTALNLTANVVPGDWPAAIGLTGVPGKSFPVMNFTEGLCVVLDDGRNLRRRTGLYTPRFPELVQRETLAENGRRIPFSATEYSQYFERQRYVQLQQSRYRAALTKCNHGQRVREFPAR